jgi:hypothetical protein
VSGVGSGPLTIEVMMSTLHHASAVLVAMAAMSLTGCSGTRQTLQGQQSVQPAASRAARPAPAADRIALLERLAADAVQEDPDFLGRPRWSVNEARRAVSLDLTPVPPEAVLSRDDPLAGPLEIMIRVAVLRRDFKAHWTGAADWAGPLDELDALARRHAAQVVSGTTGPADPGAKQMSEDASRQWDRVEQAARTYARRAGYDVEASRSVDDGYVVTFVIAPPSGRLKLMTELAYRKAAIVGDVESRWRDIKAPREKLVGRYRYRSEWPADVGGSDEGQIAVSEDTTWTFTPKKR